MKLTGFPPFPFLPGLSFQFPKRAYGERRGGRGEENFISGGTEREVTRIVVKTFFSLKCPYPPPYFQQYFTEALVNLLMLILSILFPVGMMLEGLVGLFVGEARRRDPSKCGGGGRGHLMMEDDGGQVWEGGSLEFG